VPNHELSLEVSNASNLKAMRIFDTSRYCDDVVENYLIEVLPVNKTNWVTFHVLKGFSLVVNSSSLGYKKVSDTTKLIDMPDGIYEIKQSYKPNIYTVQHYYHLRTVSTMSKLRKEWDKLLSDECKLSRAEFSVNRDKLREIDEYLAAAKYKVEECTEKKEGKEMYEWAIKLLEQYTNECQC
jgi:hypothetical protein